MTKPIIYDHTTVGDIPVRSGTYRSLVLPTPGINVVAQEVRPGVTLRKEGEWWDGHVTRQGTFLMGSAPNDVYPNDETMAFYERVSSQTLDSAGLEEVFEAICGMTDIQHFVGGPIVMSKTRGVELIGYAAEAGQLQTAEGLVNFRVGDAIVRSPDRTDRVWYVKLETFQKKYQLS